MGFCQYSTSKKVKNFTEINNIFFIDYMYDAPDNYTKIYLYGLYLCQNEDKNNSLEQFTKYFNLSKEDIFGAFAYWQDKGLIKIIDIEPFEIRYLDIVRNYEREKQIFNGKYKNFCRDIQEIISDRMISPTEFTTYIEFLDISGMQENALLTIAHYCVEKQGKDIGYKYIMTVANDWYMKGIKTQKQVLAYIDSLNETDELLSDLLKIFGIKRNANIDEINAFNFIKNELGYDIEVINQVAHKLKIKSKDAMIQLKNKMTTYYSLGFKTTEQVINYEDQKQSNFSLAKSILKELGIYYENIEPVVQNYILKWVNQGYANDTLIEIAKYCFISSIKSLEGMNLKIEKFYKLGLISLDAINSYISDIISIDDKIKEILEKLQVSRLVNSADRYMYNLWINTYNISQELLDYTIEKSIGMAQPMQYLNKILNHYHLSNITTVSQAKEFDARFEQPTKVKTQTINENVRTRNYTTEELNAFFTNIDEIKF